MRMLLSVVLLGALPGLSLAEDYLCVHYMGSQEGQFRYVAEIDPLRRPSEACFQIPAAEVPAQRALWQHYPLEQLTIVGRRLRLRQAAAPPPPPVPPTR